MDNTQDKVHVSNMTGKLAGFKAVNFDTTSSPFCQRMQGMHDAVCEHCYAQAMLTTFRKMCAPLFKRNAELMSVQLEDWQIPRFAPTDHVRFLAYGDMDNDNQLENFFQIAAASPATTFVMWTKRADLVAKHIRDIPENLTIIQSSVQLGLAEALQPGCNATFTVYDDDAAYAKAEAFACNGKSCPSCMHCYKPGVSGAIKERLRFVNKKSRRA